MTADTQQIVERLSCQFGTTVEQMFARERVPPPLTAAEWMGWLTRYAFAMTFQGVMEKQPLMLQQTANLLPQIQELFDLGVQASPGFPKYPPFLVDWSEAARVANLLRELTMKMPILQDWQKQKAQSIIQALQDADEGLESFVEDRLHNEQLPRPFDPASWCAWLVNTSCVMPTTVCTHMLLKNCCVWRS